MDNLKNLLGSAYHDGITAEEINAALSGKKLVDLNSGDYVSKDKYNKAKADLDALTEKTKDYDSLKESNEKYANEKKDADLLKKLKEAGINEKSFKYVKNDLADGTLVDSDDPKAFKTNVEKYLKDNPQFAAAQPDKPVRKIISTDITRSPSEKTEADKITETHNFINAGIRRASGMKVDVEGEGNVK